MGNFSFENEESVSIIFFSISFRHKTEHMGPLWYVLRAIQTYVVNLICQKVQFFQADSGYMGENNIYFFNV